MAVETWLFAILLTMPSFGGPITVDFKTTSLESCEKLRKVVERAFFEDYRGKGKMTACWREPTVR